MVSIRSIAGVSVVLISLAAPAFAQDPVQTGQKVYTSQRCSTCHSIGGTGNKRGPLDGVGAKLSADEIRLWITDAPAMTAKTNATRKPLMKSYTLPKEELDGLVAYLASLKK
jgi:mono/diheme cytochrome c family protein